MNKETIVITVISVLFIVGMGFLVWKGPSFSTPAAPIVASDPSLLVRANSHMTGSASAKVTMVEFGDYQCPACGAAYPILKQITDKYAGNPDFNFVFRNFPLPQHPNAPIAAEAAEAAGAQGKYFEMLDQLYANQNQWVDSSNPLTFFLSYAGKIGLAADKFTADVAASKYASAISADQSDGNQLGVNATPTVFINAVQVVNFDPKSIEAIIDADLAK